MREARQNNIRICSHSVQGVHCQLNLALESVNLCQSNPVTCYSVRWMLWLDGLKHGLDHFYGRNRHRNRGTNDEKNVLSTFHCWLPCTIPHWLSFRKKASSRTISIKCRTSPCGWLRQKSKTGVHCHFFHRSASSVHWLLTQLVLQLESMPYTSQEKPATRPLLQASLSK